MSTATYRGVQYDTAEPKKTHRDWIVKIQTIPMEMFTYRGKHYKPHHEAK